jgi:multicomponent Na+:H+ antiporter subunit B
MLQNPNVRIATKTLLPVILLFALYVQFHGDYGPGGGFQAGVIFGSGLILYGLVFEPHRLTRAVPISALLVLAPLGVLLYAFTGVAGIAFGGMYLDYSVLGPDPKAGQHLGIFLIELGVGVTVASVVVLMFTAFAARSRGT